MTCTSENRSSPRRAWQSLNPSSPGMSTSLMTASGGSVTAASSAARPSAAAVTS